MTNGNRNFAIVSALTIFVSAFLLFQIQPLISKYILPWFGGTPAVWTTAMLFFQSALLVGYAYAHFLSANISPRRQTVIHCCVLLVAALTLPIIPDSGWKPTGNEAPVARILLLLLASVGVPYMVLASTGPLIQNWYGLRLPGQSPWRLYALSNVGSLLGLLTFPFLFEPAFTSNQQAMGWSGGFILFALLCAATALVLRKHVPATASSAESAVNVPGEAGVNAADPVGTKWLFWLLLPAVASLMLLALTHHLCQDVAVVPFLWVAPLALYLLSFIICFDNEKWYRPTFFTIFTMAAILAVSGIMAHTKIDERLEEPWGVWFLETISLLPFIDLKGAQFETLAENIYFQITSVLAAVFGICMVCHGELVRLKPGVNRLTAFYLTVATGGALGGVIAAVICPIVFESYHELHIGLLLSFIFTVSVFFDAITRKAEKIRWLHIPPLALTVAATGLVAFAQWNSMQDEYLVSMRNFYGVLHVREPTDEPARRRLVNGRILHGVQLMDEEDEMMPTTYYSRSSGIGLAMEHHLAVQPRRVAVVGLGVGTLAAYGKAGDVIRFYEINPDVIKIATEYFSYLGKSDATVETVLGDARLSMENEEDQNYDIMAIDAFSSDSIPVHLMTTEAVDVFLRHLKPDGILAFHVSNRYLQLTPVVKKLADEHKLPFIVISAEDSGVAVSASTWVLVSRNQDILDHPEFAEAATDNFDKFDVRLWTDQFSNLMEVLD